MVDSKGIIVPPRLDSDLYAFDFISPDSKSYDVLLKASNWHRDLVLRHKKTFPLIAKYISLHGKNSIGQCTNFRDFTNFYNLNSIKQNKFFDHEINTLLRIPIYHDLIFVKSKSSREKSFEQKETNDTYENKIKDKIQNEGSLLWHICSLERELKKNEWKIISRRLNGSTLEEVAKIFSITRERIRQIEKRVLTRIEKYKYWDDVFRDKFESIQEKYGPAINANDLEKFDKWFSDFFLSKKGWDVFLKFFAPNMLVVNHNNILILVCRSFENEFNRDLKKVRLHASRSVSKEIIMNSVSEEKSLDKKASEYYLSILNQVENIESRSLNLHAFVSDIFEYSKTPLSVKDITKVLIEKGHSDRLCPRAINNILAKKGVCIQRSPTLYATLKSAPFSIEEIKNLCDRYYDYWMENLSLNYLNHARELRLWLQSDKALSLVFKSDWWLVAALSLDPHGRFRSDKLTFWLSEYEDSVDRTSLVEMATEMLRVSGSPLPFSVIKKKLKEKRALPNHFQLNNTKKIKNIGNKKWLYVG